MVAARKDVFRSTAQSRGLHQPVGGRIGFCHPGFNLGWLGRVFQFDGYRSVDLQGRNFPQVRSEIDHAAAGGQIAVDFAVAIRNMDVNRPTCQPPQFFRRDVGEA